MRKYHKVAISLGFMSLTGPCMAQSYAGYPDIPAVGVEAATDVVSFTPGAGTSSPNQSYTLGEPDNLSASLGRGGSIVLTMEPMVLTGDGTSAADFYIYEAVVYNSWDTFVSADNKSWTKVDSISTQANSKGTVKGYDIDTVGDLSYRYVKIVDTSNESGSTSAGADIDSLLVAHAEYTSSLKIIDTDTRNGLVFNLEEDTNNGGVDVKIISKQNDISHIQYSIDDSLIPLALSVQGNFDCDDEKDINVLATRKSDGVQLNIIKDIYGKDIKTIDNSLLK
ncbi:cell envelope biogenesis protein OmpA [Dryocola sp. BD626]|uniref:cell envelope biogenesis protein OmpA n=1 Tax=Dryocola sp. BD626 TaxID=3133273 RepID=UPI003F501C5A